jgi:hypothetical protein
MSRKLLFRHTIACPTGIPLFLWTPSEHYRLPPEDNDLRYVKAVR